MTLRNSLTPDDINRYSRQIRLEEVGIEGQERIKAASVLVVGAGALGCPVLQYLTAAGVRTIGIVDNDIVDESNLHRQVLFNTNDLNRPKPVAAKEKLSLLNPAVKVNTHFLRLLKENVLQILSPYEIIADCTDNFGTRYLINDAAVLLNKPVVYGAIHRFSGQAMVLNYRNGPTLRCIYPELPHPLEVPSCEDIGIIGSVAGIIGSMQATEVLKIILNLEGVLTGKMFFFDSLSFASQIFKFQRDTEKAAVRELAEYPDICSSEEDGAIEITVSDFRDLLKTHPDLKIIDLRDEEHKKDLGFETIEIPFRELFRKIDMIPHAGPKVFYCSYGIKSSVVISYLRKVKMMDKLYRLAI